MGVGLEISDGVADVLAAEMRRKRLSAFGSITKVEKHQDLLVLWKTEGIMQLVKRFKQGQSQNDSKQTKY